MIQVIKKKEPPHLAVDQKKKLHIFIKKLYIQQHTSVQRRAYINSTY